MSVQTDRARPPSNRDLQPSSDPEITIAVCTRDRAEDLERYALPALAAQTHPRHEVLVVDDASSDETADVVRRWQAEHPEMRLRLERIPTGESRGLSHARNVAVAAARAPIIAFTDDDARPAPDYLERIAAAFDARPEIGAVFGKTFAGDGDEVQSFGWAHGVNMSYRRAILHRHAFDSNLRYLGSPYYDELDLTLRLERSGVRRHFEASAVVRHYDRPAKWRKMRRVGGQVNAAYSDAKLCGRLAHFRSLLWGWFLLLRFRRDQEAFRAHVRARRPRLCPVALYQFFWIKDAIIAGRPHLIPYLAYLCLFDIPLRAARRARAEAELANPGAACPVPGRGLFMRERFRRLFRYVRFLGVRSTAWYCVQWLMRRKRNTLRIPGMQHTLSWRRGTSDFEVIRHTFEQRDCDVDLPFTPDAIIDGGANIGTTAAFFATRYPHCPVIAVEPDGENFALLRENSLPHERVHTVQAALWADDATLYIQNPDAEKWAIEVGCKRPDPGATPITGRSIGSLLDSFAPAAERLLLKLDIEGAEEELLCRAATPWIDRVGAILLEVHDGRARAAIVDKLARAGFCESRQGEKLVFIREAIPVVVATGRGISRPG